MPNESLSPIEAAEAAIKARKATREATQLDHRGALALELIADEMTRMYGEIKTLRMLYAAKR